MYLLTHKRSKGIYMEICESNWDTETKSKKHTVIKNVGYDYIYKDMYEDPVEHFKNEVKQMNKDILESKKQNIKTITYDTSQHKSLGDISNNTKFDYIIGHAPIMQIYNSLELDNYFKLLGKNFKSQYPMWSIVKDLVIARILKPDSLMSSYEKRRVYYDNIKSTKDRFDYELHDVYRCLGQLQKNENELPFVLFNKLKTYLGSIDTSITYYDVTNYYFEIDFNDSLRKKGVSKEKSSNPIVQMGLLMSNDGIPLTYKVFEGNTSDCETFSPTIEMITKFQLGRTVVVADKGLNTAKNILFEIQRGNGYVFSKKIRNSTKEFRSYILEEADYVYIGTNGYKLKHTCIKRVLKTKDTNGKTIKTEIEELQVVFFSPDQARRSRKAREESIRKAHELIKNPGTYTASEHYGAKKYIKNIKIDKNTGEILENCKNMLLFDHDELKKEEELDGYYALISSELNESPEKIIELYKGLWKIEETFKITKSILETRPMYVSREEHIKGHFMICYLGLVLSRLMEIELGNKYTIRKIRDSLNLLRLTRTGNLFICNYYDEIIDEIIKKMNIPNLGLLNFDLENLIGLFSKTNLKKSSTVKISE